MIKNLYRKIFPEKVRLQFHIQLRKMKGLLLHGDRFYCPCCEKSSSRFLSKGNGLIIRTDAVCPNCGSLERTRLLYLYLKNETDIFTSGKHILHFAPETALKEKLIGNEHYIDVDINPNFARFQMDITDLKFEDNKFDFIICSHVLGHIPDEKKALSELFRVLKPDGLLFLLSLMDGNLEQTKEENNSDKTERERLELYGEKDLERLYGNDFAERIKTPAVSVERIDYRTRFSAAENERMSLGDGNREIIYLVKKKALIP